MPRLLLAIVLVLSCVPSSTAAPAPTSIRKLMTELHRAAVEPDVPREVAGKLTQLKHALRDVVIDAVTAGPPAETKTEALTSHIIDRLAEGDVPVGDDSQTYGSIERIAFERPVENPHWLITTVALSIPYGNDVSLYLFEDRAGRWRHALSVEANGYTGIEDAQSGLEYRVAEGTENRAPYLVVTNTSAQASSVFHRLVVKALRPGPSPARPIVMLDRHLFFCIDDRYYVAFHREGFGVVMLSGAVDPANSRGVEYDRFEIAGNSARCVRHVEFDATTVVGFWASSSWSKAKQSLAPAMADATRPWFERLHAEEVSCDFDTHTHRETRDGDERLFAIAGCTGADHEVPVAYAWLRLDRAGVSVEAITQTSPVADNWFVTYRIDDVDAKPVLVHAAAAVLPAGVDVPRGFKLPVTLTVRKDGTVTGVTFRSWPDAPVLVPALDAVRQWKYKPAIAKGVPVDVLLGVELTFGNQSRPAP